MDYSCNGIFPIPTLLDTTRYAKAGLIHQLTTHTVLGLVILIPSALQKCYMGGKNFAYITCDPMMVHSIRVHHAEDDVPQL